MSDEVQGPRVVPWATKLSEAEREIVRIVAAHDDTTAADLIRDLALPTIRKRYDQIVAGMGSGELYGSGG